MQMLMKVSGVALATAVVATVLASPTGAQAKGDRDHGHDYGYGKGDRHGGHHAPFGPRLNRRPSGLSHMTCTRYDGINDDLLTGGLGPDGLASITPPGFTDPLNPTAAELRRLAIYTNYRALLDMTENGGYGVLYGPTVDVGDNGLVAGQECLGFFGRDNVTAMVQIPTDFDWDHPCIVTGPSSGSRGIYGAIGSTAGWALGHGCAMAYTDTGTGTGVHDLAEDTVNLIRGQRAGADEAGGASNFTAPISDRARERFNNENPDRFAFKHQYSRTNPEAAWGQDVLDALTFAFYRLHREYPGRSFTRRNTVVIAAGVSNGGGAAVRAAEQDRWGLIDGVVVSEPNVTPRYRAPFTINFGDNPPFAEHSRSLYDYVSFSAVYEGCANADPEPGAPLNLTDPQLLRNRCIALGEKGLLPAGTVEEQAAAARAKLLRFGLLEEQLILDPAYWYAYLDPAVLATYVNAYSRARITDVLCGYTFGATDPVTGAPRPLPPESEAILFATSTGIPPTSGIDIINNRDPAGPTRDQISRSPSTGLQDQNLDAVLCGRALFTGIDPETGRRLKGRAQYVHQRLKKGIRDVLASGDLHGRPGIIIAGRNDALVPVNHAARAYYGFNQVVEGADSKLRYMEVTNAHHLDAFNALPGFDNRFVPLHHYFTEALDRMLDHLRNGTPLPPSQVVQTVPRTGAADPIGPANVPPISDTPGAEEIVFSHRALQIPE